MIFGLLMVGLEKRDPGLNYCSTVDWAFLDEPAVRPFAHRGGNRVAPENTMAAFAHAVSLGYRYLETDVHCSSDGVLVAFHDAGLERLVGSDQQISHLTWDEIQRIEIRSESDDSVHRIPRMEDLVMAFPEALFNIDPKADASVGPLVRMIRELAVLDRVCVGSFSDERTEHAQEELGPGLCTSMGPSALIRTLLPGLSGPDGYAIAAIPRRLGIVPTNRTIVSRYQEAGLAVHVWTVNEPDDMQRLVDLEVDGIMTDDVELLLDVLNQASSSTQGQ